MQPGCAVAAEQPVGENVGSRGTPGVADGLADAAAAELARAGE
jgi:hypothetical protein